MSQPSLDLPTGHERASYVQALFNRIADRYDALNDLMTAGQHRLWKRQMVRILGVRPGERVLDLCTGTGDLALLLAKVVGPDGSVTALDFSAQMLERARKRPGADRVTWLEGDATRLPFPDASFDHVTVGFGLRNVAFLDDALAEMHRVLRPGGTAGSLDLAKPRLPVLSHIIRLYEFAVVPRLARLVGAPTDAYRYLPESNVAFPDREGLARRFQTAGFEGVVGRDRGLGAVAIVTGQRA